MNRKSLLFAVLLSVSLTAQADWDCTTEDGKIEAILDFVEGHYGPTASMVYPPEDGLIEVYFSPYNVDDGEYESDCMG